MGATPLGPRPRGTVASYGPTRPSPDGAAWLTPTITGSPGLSAAACPRWGKRAFGLTRRNASGTLPSTRGERHLNAADIEGRHRAPARVIFGPAYSSAEIANASPKPSVVARPTILPPRAKASGIIVSASIVRIAPAANESTNAIVLGEASPKSP